MVAEEQGISFVRFVRAVQPQRNFIEGIWLLLGCFCARVMPAVDHIETTETLLFGSILCFIVAIRHTQRRSSGYFPPAMYGLIGSVLGGEVIGSTILAGLAFPWPVIMVYALVFWMCSRSSLGDDTFDEWWYFGRVLVWCFEATLIAVVMYFSHL